ncbi:SphA family protein [Pseudomonas palleroniana]|uniref:SphA family protein n=1 Tax=Pseudomonas palleroniana TaxID=191390 RepID=UPI001FD4780D|nr:transporter [Pseudomonas palleroniana]UOP10289.1 transporter [Pseudomonas palleroniana]
MTNIQQTLSLLLAVAAIALFSRPVQAKEGVDWYPYGSETWLAGVMPPPGVYFVDYAGYYSGNLRDGNGKKAPNSVHNWFNAFRIAHITESGILGGTFAWHLIQPTTHMSFQSPSEKVSGSRLGDLTLGLANSWRHENSNWVAGLGFNLPTGYYKAGRPEESVGTGYWSIEPSLAYTYLSDKGWEFSTKLAYFLNATNHDYKSAPKTQSVDYHSGDEFHVDYLIGKRFGPMGFGISGYWVKQIKDDEIDGSSVPATPFTSEGRRGQVFAIGPSATYQTKSGIFVSLQWNHEYNVRNRFGGDKTLMKFSVPF